MEKYLHDRLQTFNLTSNNSYKVKWGTSLEFINDNYTAVNGQVMTPAQVFDLQIQVKERERILSLQQRTADYHSARLQEDNDGLTVIEQNSNHLASLQSEQPVATPSNSQFLNSFARPVNLSTTLQQRLTLYQSHQAPSNQQRVHKSHSRSDFMLSVRQIQSKLQQSNAQRKCLSKDPNKSVLHPTSKPLEHQSPPQPVHKDQDYIFMNTHKQVKLYQNCKLLSDRGSISSQKSPRVRLPSQDLKDIFKPNQTNSFFASGLTGLGTTEADTRRHSSNMDKIRHTRKIIRQKTPLVVNCNRQEVRSINSMACSRVSTTNKLADQPSYVKDTWEQFVRTRPHDFAGQVNHVQRALHSVQDDLDKKQTQIGKGSATTTTVYLQKFGERMHNRQSEDTRPRQIVVQKDTPDFTKTNLQLLLGKSKSQYIGMRSLQKWMQSHRFNDGKTVDNINTLVFAKEFFHIVDINSNGFLMFDELATAMVGLGITSDQSFVKKVLKAANPQKFCSEVGYATGKLPLHDFLKLFKQDTISEHITDCLRAIAIKGDVKLEVQEHEQATVAQMLEVVKQMWYKLVALGSEKDPLELDVDLVTALLALDWKVDDQANCLKYLKRVCYTQFPAKVANLSCDYKLDWDDFHGIFCRGIFKYALITAAKNLLQADENAKEPNLMIRLIVARVKHLWTTSAPVSHEHQDHHQHHSEHVKRKISAQTALLDKLEQIQQKRTQQKDDKMPYEQFVVKLQGAIVEIDPNFVDVAFTEDLIEKYQDYDAQQTPSMMQYDVRQVASQANNYQKPASDTSNFDSRSKSTTAQTMRRQSQMSDMPFSMTSAAAIESKISDYNLTQTRTQTQENLRQKKERFSNLREYQRVVNREHPSLTMSYF